MLKDNKDRLTCSDVAEIATLEHRCRRVRSQVLVCEARYLNPTALATRKFLKSPLATTPIPRQANGTLKAFKIDVADLKDYVRRVLARIR
jgi:hypothetical protein